MMRSLIALCLIAAACGGKTSGGGSPKAAGNNVAVAVVMNGWEIWVGNDRVLKDDDPARYLGALDYVKAGVDGAGFAQLPAGSLGTLIVYSNTATVKLPMGPIAKLNGEALGGQKDYMGTVGNELVAGVELGLAELSKATAARKVLIVLGDGNDTNKDTGPARLEELRKRAAADKIEVHAIVYKTSVSEKDTAVTSLVPDAHVANSVDDVKASLGSVLAQLRK